MSGATDNHETFSPIPCPVDRTNILRQQRGLDVDSPNLQQQRDDTDMTPPASDMEYSSLYLFSERDERRLGRSV
jgi:hypothetical protein